jgi:Carboxypeptidase regulatory-like domain
VSQVRPILLALFMLAFAAGAAGQTADLSGVVADATRAVILSARVTITKEDTGLIQTTSCHDQGLYRFAFLDPGSYSVTAEAAGFRPLTRSHLKLDPGQQARLDFTLVPATVEQSITVKGRSVSIQTESSAVGTEVDSRLVQELPLNGRTFQSLIALAPGVVLPTTLNQTVGDSTGIFINGQRGTANYFTVDGVSANVGMGSSPFFVGPTAGGAEPALTVLGTTHNLISIDDMQEFTLQTSTYSADIGRAGGGQLLIVSRSGSNQFHGAVFDFFRNEALDANDWFANANGLPRAAHRQNDFGGVIGGPIIKNRTFFFFSYEGLRLRLPFTVTAQVPSLQARQVATGAIQQLMNAFPLPTGSQNPTSMLAPFTASNSTSTSSDNTSIRIDHAITGNVSLFGRYSEARSNASALGVLSGSQLNSNAANFRSFTLGANFALSPKVTNVLRLNYSRNAVGGAQALESVGGAVPPPDSLLFPAPFASPRSSSFGVHLGNSNFQTGRLADNLQRQVNIVNNTSIRQGSHDLRVGVDYRYLDPHYGPWDYQQILFFSGIRGALSGVARQANITSFDSVNVGFRDFSTYAQDSWKVHPRLTLNYGLRWELNPPPYAKGKQPLVTLRGFPDLAALQLAPPGTPVYRTGYANFAPRFGAAYQLFQHPGRETVVRGGFGVFYDLGVGNIGDAATSFPYLRGKMATGVPYPLTQQVAAPPPPASFNPPYTGLFNVFAPDHQLPRSYQWNVTIDQRLGSNQLISASYVGELGRKLLRENVLTDPNPMFLGSNIDLTTNASSSDYQALELQFQRRISHGLAALVSYTWAHSIDDTSDDQGGNNLTDPRLDRGPSDFDVRHTLSAAFIYDIPAPGQNRTFRTVLGNWSMGGIFAARTALPVNAYVLRGDINVDPSLVVDSGQIRPDRVPGVPLYSADPTAPGGRRINPAAFSVPVEIRQGDLGRNALRGFPLTQLDLAVRRQFELTENLKLQFRLELFNIFNHPNFGSVDSNLGFYGPPLEPEPSFGVAVQSLANTGGASPLYNVGGPRSIQVSLRLGF